MATIGAEIPERVAAIFADARTIHGEALERLQAGDIRDAAEKAWCATKRATDALILARTGREPRTSGQTTRGLRLLRRTDQIFDQMETRYSARAHVLHGECFYDGNCEPEDVLARDIREIVQYINDAEALTGR